LHIADANDAGDFDLSERLWPTFHPIPNPLEYKLQGRVFRIAAMELDQSRRALRMQQHIESEVCRCLRSRYRVKRGIGSFAEQLALQQILRNRAAVTLACVLDHSSDPPFGGRAGQSLLRLPRRN